MNHGETQTMLRNRLITGSLLSITLLTLLYFDERLGSVVCDCGIKLQPGILLAGLAIAITPLIAIELGAISHGAGIRSNIPIMIISMWSWILMFYLIPSSMETSNATGLMCAMFIGTVLLSVIALSKKKNLKGVIAGTAFTVISSTYISFGIGMFILLRHDHSAWWIIGLIAIIKMCDTGAFFIGCNLGKHKLIPWVSPGKTWEGLIGGLVTASLAAIGLAVANNHWLQTEVEIPLITAAALGLLFGFLGQSGDLVMSVFKRDSNIKDASSALPGLGGLLDVLDSLLLVGPAAYWLLPGN